MGVEEVELVQEEKESDETGLKEVEHKEEKMVVEEEMWRRR